MRAINFSIPVSFLKEGKTYVAFTPALDISTCGKTLREAKKRFEELVQIFFEEVERKGTLEEALESLGWERIDGEWCPPQEIEHEQKKFDLRVRV